MNWFEKIIRLFVFGRPIPGEKSGYVGGDYTPKLKKWEQR